MRRRSFVLVVALATVLASAAPALGREANLDEVELGSTLPVERSEYDSYIVLLKSDPLVVTEGRENLRTNRARNRGQQMRQEQNRVLEQTGVGVENKVSEYVNVLNGFSAHISHRQAQRLQDHPDVALVLPDELYQPMTDSSPEFLGLTGPGGALRTGEVTGRGVVVGIIDTGIWPEHPSFAPAGISAPPIEPLQDIVVGGPLGPYQIPACNFGNTAHNTNDAAFSCNNKLVGARQVLPNYRQLIGAEDFEFDSARDDDGHGTHTASTAAGNANVSASIFGNDFGAVTGIAPDAHVIAYKGLGALGGFGSDLALAIDLAVFDGVDVINYSIGGGSTLITADEIAFLFAADAGVHVATSAGNSGPGPASIRNPGKVPWLTTVGANTQSRFFQGTIELGNGATYIGSSVTPATGGVFPLVDAADAGDDLCHMNSLDETVVEGAIVLCRRGSPARLMSSAEVLRAGGVGVILYNNTDVDNLFTDNFHLPTVMIDNTPGLAIKAYIASAGAGATAELRDTATKGTWAPAPSMAVFSSRGPNVFPDLLKPDITAPGFQILAGNSPFPGPIINNTVPRVQGELFQSISGTSMSSPHVAGLYALLKQANPDWTPAIARSAMMTTAHQNVRDNDRVSQADPFDFGAGHARPGRPNQRGSSFQPGLAYNAGLLEYFGFLCDAFPGAFANPAATCASLQAAGIPILAKDLNYPSISVANLTGTTTVTRTVTSVAREAGVRRYTASIESPPGYSVSVSPSSFNLARGQSQTYEVTITHDGAPSGEWRFGSLSWNERSGQYSVRSPITVRGEAILAPAEVVVTGTEGSSSFEVTFGYNGPYTAAAHGFAADTGQSGTVAHDPDQTCQCDGTGGAGEVPHNFTLSSSAHLRISMSAADLVGAASGTDIDLFLYRNGTLVASSTAPDTNEVINVAFPADGEYTLWVHGWQVPSGTVDYTFHLWDVPASPGGGSLAIDSAPTQATVGGTGTIEFSWSGLSPGQTYLGGISHDTGGLAPLRLTLVRADN